MNITKIQQKLNKAKEDVEKYEKELESEKNKSNQSSDGWISIDNIKKGYEIQSKPHHFNCTLANAMKDLKNGEEVATYEVLQTCRNDEQLRIKLGLVDTWEFVYPNPDKISSDNGYVARFYADSDYANLYCGRVAVNSSSNLGVRFVRKKITKRNKK